MANIDVALRRIREGFYVFPAKADDSRAPQTGIQWRFQSTQQEVAAHRWWARWPESAVAIDLGKSNLIVIDCDRHDPDKDGVEAFWALAKEHGYDLNDVPMVTTPRRGVHLMFRQRPGEKRGNGTGDLPAGVDVRGNGGYVLAAGSVLADGREYTLRGDLSEIPVLPDWLAEILDGGRGQAPDRVPSPTPSPKHDDEGPTIAEMEEILSFIPPSLGYTDWCTCLMGIAEATGGSTEGIDIADQWSAGGGSKYKGRSEIEAKFRSFRSSGVTWSTVAAMARDYGADLSEIALRHSHIDAAVDDGFDASQLRVGGQIESASAEPSPFSAKAGYVEPDWCRPKGVLNDIADWIVATSRRPNRPLAVASAIAIVGTMCGRHIATPTNCGTHLYIGCIGSASVGKDRPLQSIYQVFSALELPTLAVTAKFKSDSAIEKTVAESPCCVAVVDEIGTNLFSRMSSSRASTHESSISGVLRELWSTSFAVFMTSKRATDLGQTKTSIDAPAFSIYGTSTIDQFYRSLGSNMIENGFMSRFTIIEAAPRSEPVDDIPLDRLVNVPSKIVHDLLEILPKEPEGKSGDLSHFGKNVFNAETKKPHVTRIEWANSSAKDRFREIEREVLAKIDALPHLGDIMGRTAEMTVRLATIHAISARGRDTMVTCEDVEWGFAVAMASANSLIDHTSDRLARNDYQDSYNLVRRIIKGRDEITRSQITKAIKGRIKPQDVTSIIIQLVEAGMLELVETKPTGGRKLTVYRVNKDYQDEYVD